MTTLLIKNVRIVGEEKKTPDRADVFISGTKISAVGSFPEKRADQVIEGQGAYLSAGFIDADTTSDHYLTLFHDPGQEDFLRQGVTSIIGGHCGGSLAPLLYGTLEAIKKWADVTAINVDWHTVEEFFRTLERRPLGVNFGTMAGHATIRRAFLGDAIRDLTEGELNVFCGIFERAFHDGALGFSAGLEYAHERLTPRSELAFLLDVAKKKNGIFSLHCRRTGMGIKSASEEAISLAGNSGVTTLLTHFVPLHGAEREYESALEAIDALSDRIPLHFSVYPSLESMMPIHRFLPEWARGPFEQMAHNLQNGVLWERIKKELVIPDPALVTIVRAEGAASFAGRTLKEAMEFYSLDDPREALRRFMLATNLHAVAVHRNIVPDLLQKVLAHPRSIIGSHAPSFGDHLTEDALRGNDTKPIRSTSTFTSFLAKVIQDGLLPLHEAIEKITKKPAELLGLSKRGSIRAGYYADVVVFSPAGEIQDVVVNGSIAVKDGEAIGVRSGMILRGNQ